MDRQRLRQSFPDVKTIAIVLAVCLLLGIAVTGTFPAMLIWFIIGALFLITLTLRKYDPDAYEALYETKAYGYRQQRDELYDKLTALVEAVETYGTSTSPDIVAARAQQGRDLLNSLNNRRNIQR